MDCREVSPPQVGFPGVQTIARLRRRVRRKGKKTTEIVYLISSLTLPFVPFGIGPFAHRGTISIV